MSKENAKKATLKDLILKKNIREENKFKTKEVYIESIDKTLVFNKLSEEKILDLMSDIKDIENINLRENYELCKQMIYFSCSMLQDTELHKELEIVDPLDIVNALFEMKEVFEITEEITELIGLGDFVGEIKNS